MEVMFLVSRIVVVSGSLNVGETPPRPGMEPRVTSFQRSRNLEPPFMSTNLIFLWCGLFQANNIGNATHRTSGKKLQPDHNHIAIGLEWAWRMKSAATVQIWCILIRTIENLKESEENQYQTDAEHFDDKPYRHCGQTSTRYVSIGGDIKRSKRDSYIFVLIHRNGPNHFIRIICIGPRHFPRKER